MSVLRARHCIRCGSVVPPHDGHDRCAPCLGLAHAVLALEGKGCFVCASYDFSERLARYEQAKQYAALPPSDFKWWMIRSRPTGDAIQAAAPASEAPRSARAMETRPASSQATPHKPVPPSAAANAQPWGFKGWDIGDIAYTCHSGTPSADAAWSALASGV